MTTTQVHIVHFDSADKIVQIRQYWDQGSLLKQIDVIGARSRNWPIREGPEQARLIKSSAAVAQPDSPSSSRPSTASRGAGDVSIRSRGPTTNVTNDPHASLSLFKPREVDDEALPGTYETAPRALSAKPPPREYSELFVDENAASPSAQNQRFPAKGGSSKNFKNNSLYEGTEEDSAAASTSIKTNPKKYNHFEFGDGNDDEVGTLCRAQRLELPCSFCHVLALEPVTENYANASKVKTPPAARKTQAPFKGNTSNNGQGLYKNHITGDDDDEGTAHSDGRALNNDTKQTRNKNRSKDFGAHWEMHDNSPANTKSNENYRPGKAGHQATKNNFDFYGESPQQSSYKINIAGNGMGNRAGTQFSLFDDEPEEPAAEDRTIGNHKGIRATGDGMGGRKDADKSFWDF